MKDKWCYSWNEENFRGSFDSEEEAIKAAREEGSNAPYVYIGTCTECTLGWPGISASDVIEAISEEKLLKVLMCHPRMKRPWTMC